VTIEALTTCEGFTGNFATVLDWNYNERCIKLVDKRLRLPTHNRIRCLVISFLV
jgi:hypothetical protein